MANKYGFSSVNQQLNISSTPDSDLKNQVEILAQNVISARVTDIILDSNYPNFFELGGWNSVGTIYFEPVGGANLDSSTNNIALPLLPYLKNYPLVNELVLLFSLPDSNIGSNDDTKRYYYLNTIAIWNNQHMNGYPNLLKSSQTQPTENKSYQEIQDGQTRKSTDQEVDYDFNSPLVGGTFAERSNIHPLLSYAGDIILEGRWGNSIRFGSTVKADSNNWSSNGENGEPITIIRNGQSPESSDEGWVPVVEDINLDLSSIYLTSNQTLPLNTEITSFPTLQTPPEAITAYSGSQVILNSDRLVFSSKADSIILNSSKTISLSSIQSMGLYSQEGDITLQSGKGNIRLGDVNANQSVILGDNFMKDFSSLLGKLQILCQTLSAEPYLAVSGPAASSTKTQISQMLNNIKDYTSKIVKTL
jgi:hypothetical protein